MFKIVLAGAAMSLASTASAEAPMAEADVSLGKVSNQYICRFDASVDRSQVGAEAAKAGGPMGQILFTYRNTIRGFAVRMPVQPGTRSHIAEMRANNPKISGCEQDQYVKALVQGKGKPGGGGGGGETTDWGVTRVGGSGTAVAGRTAWVIDTGIDLDHPDLNVDVSRSVNFVERESSPDDTNGHGTHVAGTIAAISGNNRGVAGVAPGATVVAVRVLNRRGSGTWAGIIAGVDHVGIQGSAGDVANMSLGGGASQSVDDAVKCAADGPASGVSPCSAPGGIRFTIAAGNSSAEAQNYSPARAVGANIYTVSSFAKGDSAIDEIDPWSSFSNYGPPIRYAEPGSSVLSTYKDGTYATLSGTSMAAPHLAGILMAGSVRSDSTVDGDPAAPADPIGER